MIDLLFYRLAPYIKPSRNRIILVILLSFAMAAIGGAQVKLVKPLFDHGLNPDSTTKDIFFLAGILVALGIVNFPCRFYHFYWMRGVTEGATCLLREEMFAKVQKLPASYFANRKQGQMLSSLINDTQIFSQGFRAIVDLIREPLKAAVYLGLAFYSNWKLTVVIFVMAPFLIAIFSIFGKRVVKTQQIVQEEHGELTHTIAEGLASNKIAKAFNLQDFLQKRFNSVQNKYYSAQKKLFFSEEMSHPLVELVGGMAFAGVIVMAHFQIQSKAMTVGDFIAFIAALALFMDPIRKFSQANSKLAQARAASNRIFAFLETPEEKDGGDKSVNKLESGLEVKNISFSYDDESEVLRNFSMSLKKGEKVALVGLSGSGKSTLINALLGLYPIKSGDILIDGVSIHDLKLKSLRGLFGLVSQDIFLFNDSILMNLTLGGNFTEEEIQEALKVAYAEEFINDLPKGIHTVIGDRGTRLSGGQQQRLTIARAYLQRTPVLLFDEATSALDNESEKVVQKALENLAGKKSVVAVAHRLSTIQDFDRIYVLSRGNLVEQGNHAELMSLGGEYAKLYELSIKS